MNALMYHDVKAARADGRYSFTFGQFNEHLAALGEAIGSAPWVPGDDPGTSGFALTFDDGDPEWLRVGEALLERRWRASFFVITGAVGRAGRLSASDIRRLASMGHVIGSHSADHPSRLSSRTSAYILDQWTRSRKALEDILGREVTNASVPGGFYSDRVARASDSAGLRHLFTSEPVARSWTVGRCRVLGRFALTKGMSGRKVARIASGSLPEQAGQYLCWNLKKALKAVVLHPYRAIRARAGGA